MLNVLTFLFALELGIIPQNFVTGYDHRFPQLFMESGFYTTLEAEIRLFNILYATGFVRTEMLKHNDKMVFNPNLALYGIGGGIKIGMLTIGVRHLCGHPIIPFVYRALKEPNFDTAYNEIFIRIESSQKEKN